MGREGKKGEGGKGERKGAEERGGDYHPQSLIDDMITWQP